jgi:putative spermidine/putrescine transport system ATP-binding protein
MDEPLSNLDAKLRLEMRSEIRRLHQSLGLTTVYVTHDQEEALSLADRLVVLRAGRVQQIGSPQELHTRPVNWHVADFMGYRNLWPMRAQAAQGGLITVEAGGLRLVGDPVGQPAPGDEVVCGVRPEDVRVDAPDATTNVLPAEIEVVEYQGRELAAEARTDAGIRVHLRTDRRVAPGDRVTLSIDPQRLLVFPADSDERPATGLRDVADAGVSREPELAG